MPGYMQCSTCIFSVSYHTSHAGSFTGIEEEGRLKIFLSSKDFEFLGTNSCPPAVALKLVHLATEWSQVSSKGKHRSWSESRFFHMIQATKNPRYSVPTVVPCERRTQSKLVPPRFLVNFNFTISFRILDNASKAAWSLSFCHKRLGSQSPHVLPLRKV